MAFFEFLAHLIQVQICFRNSQPPSYMTTCARHVLTKFAIAPSSAAEEDTCRVRRSANFWDFLQQFCVLLRSRNVSCLSQVLSNLRSIFEITASKRISIVLFCMATVAKSSHPTLYYTHENACSLDIFGILSLSLEL